MDRSLQTPKQWPDDFTHSQSSAGTTTINYILQGWWEAGEGVSSQWKISFPSKGRGWNDSSTAVHGPASDNLGKPQRSPPRSMNNLPPPPQNEEHFTDLESRADRGGMGTGTGRHHTQPCCCFSCMEQTLPCLHDPLLCSRHASLCILLSSAAGRKARL